MTDPLEKVEHIIVAAGDEGLRAAAEHLLQVSRTKVPVEEGTLKRSGRTHYGIPGQAAVSYSTNYAVRQHEDLTLRHKTGGQAKYLEQPAIQEAGTLAKLVAASVEKRLR